MTCQDCKGSGRVVKTLDGDFLPAGEVSALGLAEQMKVCGTNPGQSCPSCSGVDRTVHIKSDEPAAEDELPED